MNSIYILNLPKRTDRLQFQKNQLKTILSIVKFVTPIIVNKAGNFQNKATRSCFLSHIKIIRNIMYSANYNNFHLIMEDDTVIPNIKAITRNIKKITNLSDSWDMLYLYKKQSTNINFSHPNYDSIDSCLATYAYIIHPSSLHKIYNKLKKEYLIIKKAKRKLIRESHIDQVLKYKIHPQLKVITTKRNLIQNDDKTFGSDINWQNNLIDD